MSLRDRILLALAVLWTVFTVVALGVITAMILREPAFPLGLGWIRTSGPAGLWITVPSILLGIVGLALLLMRPTTGSRVLFLYSGLWTLMLVPGVLAILPTIVRHPLAYCADGRCTPWVITVSITIAFTLSTFSYAHRAYVHPDRS
ncbi:MAG: hypothetical protein WCC04_08825 [Terriglobales bacterium]